MSNYPLNTPEDVSISAPISVADPRKCISVVGTLRGPVTYEGLKAMSEEMQGQLRASTAYFENRPLRAVDCFPALATDVFPAQPVVADDLPVIPPPKPNPASQGAQENASGAAVPPGDAAQQPPEAPPVRPDAPHQAKTAIRVLPPGIAKLSSVGSLIGTRGIRLMYERNMARLEWGRVNNMSFDDMTVSPVTGLLAWHPIPGHSEFLPVEVDDEVNRCIDPRLQDLAREFLEQTKPDRSKGQSVLPY